MRTYIDRVRDYLADFLEDEEYWLYTEDGIPISPTQEELDHLEPDSEAEDWFAGLARFVADLPDDDPTLLAALEPMRPFVEDDDRIDCTMYPQGAAIRFIEEGWGGDFTTYFAGFVAALQEDHATWQAILERRGSQAELRSEVW